MVSTLEKRLLLSQLKLKVVSPRCCRVSYLPGSNEAAE